MKHIIFFILIFSAALTNSMERSGMHSPRLQKNTAFTDSHDAKEFDCWRTTSLFFKVLGLGAQVAVYKPVSKFCEFSIYHEKNKTE